MIPIKTPVIVTSADETLNDKTETTKAGETMDTGTTIADPILRTPEQEGALKKLNLKIFEMERTLLRPGPTGLRFKRNVLS